MLMQPRTALVAMLAGVSLLTIPAFAQDAAQTAPKPAETKNEAKKHANHERLLQELNLTQDQKDKIKAIQEAAKAKIQPIHDNKSLTPEQKKEQMKPIRKETMKQIMAILTPEQKAKLKELRKAHQEKQEEQPAPKTGQ